MATAGLTAVAQRAAKRIVPMFDRILVERIKPQERTKSGIYIPDTAKEELHEGTVLAVGPGALNKEGSRQPIDLKEGDVVLLPTYGGQAIKFEEENFNLYRESEILAKVNKDA
eukprot:TRINITY_DN24246_c0_g1_i1.p1 TRINITY_DN24246_c0_g1~~TRINITY_DN24246_c0_g1_i1.p1  ORF type:complete len:113 (-),score=21.67 TRINITY_DN24246_c0_g1_i1:162-500(-)